MILEEEKRIMGTKARRIADQKRCNKVSEQQRNPNKWHSTSPMPLPVLVVPVQPFTYLQKSRTKESLHVIAKKTR